MHILTLNTEWMLWNFFLAILGVFFGWLMFKEKSRIRRILWFLLWLLFVPNTIYILTDLIHFSHQWYRLHGIYRLLLTSQYAVFIPTGIITFMFAVHFFDETLRRIKRYHFLVIVIMNILIAFGVTMGRFVRTNSWEVFTQPVGVLRDILNVVSSSDSLFFFMFFSILTNAIYFFLRPIFFITSPQKHLAFKQRKS